MQDFKGGEEKVRWVGQSFLSIKLCHSWAHVWGCTECGHRGKCNVKPVTRQVYCIKVVRHSVESGRSISVWSKYNNSSDRWMHFIISYFKQNSAQFSSGLNFKPNLLNLFSVKRLHRILLLHIKISKQLFTLIVTHQYTVFFCILFQPCNNPHGKHISHTVGCDNHLQRNNETGSRSYLRRGRPCLFPMPQR